MELRRATTIKWVASLKAIQLGRPWRVASSLLMAAAVLRIPRVPHKWAYKRFWIQVSIFAANLKHDVEFLLINNDYFGAHGALLELSVGQLVCVSDSNFSWLSICETNNAKLKPPFCLTYDQHGKITTTTTTFSLVSSWISASTWAKLYRSLSLPTRQHVWLSGK